MAFGNLSSCTLFMDTSEIALQGKTLRVDTPIQATTGSAWFPKASSKGSDSGSLSFCPPLDSCMRLSPAGAPLFWAVITVPSNVCMHHLVYVDCFSNGRRKRWSRKGKPFWKSKPFMTKSAIWSSMKNKGLFYGSGCFAIRAKQTNKKLSSLFSDVPSVINHRWLSKGNKTHAVIRRLFQWCLISLNFLLWGFLCWVPKYWLQSLLPEKFNKERIWNYENTGEKRKKRNYPT